LTRGSCSICGLESKLERGSGADGDFVEALLLHIKHIDFANGVDLILHRTACVVPLAKKRQGGKKHGFRGYFEVQATLLTVSTHHHYPTCGKGRFGSLTSSHQISSGNIDRKILLLNKNQYIH